MDDATYTIVQKRFLRGQQTLTIEGDKLKAEYRRGLSFHEYRFNLRGFSPEPLRIKRAPMANIAALVLCTIVGLVFVPLLIIGGSEVPGAAAGFGALLLIIGILEWISTVKAFVNITVFDGPGGRVALWPDLPTKEQFDRFLAVLTARIRNAQTGEQLVLRRLRQAEIIDDWQYDQAMELLKQGNDRPDAP
jgi:hypothetical protein